MLKNTPNRYGETMTLSEKLRLLSAAYDECAPSNMKGVKLDGAELVIVAALLLEAADKLDELEPAKRGRPRGPGKDVVDLPTPPPYAEPQAAA